MTQLGNPSQKIYIIQTDIYRTFIRYFCKIIIKFKKF